MNIEDEKDIEQLFGSSFEDFEVTPPPGVKAGIDAQLPPRVPATGKPWYMRGLTFIAAGVVIGVTALVTQLGNGKTKRDHSVQPQTQLSEHKPEEPASVSTTSNQAGASSEHAQSPDSANQQGAAATSLREPESKAITDAGVTASKEKHQSASAKQQLEGERSKRTVNAKKSSGKKTVSRPATLKPVTRKKSASSSGKGRAATTGNAAAVKSNGFISSGKKPDANSPEKSEAQKARAEENQPDKSPDAGNNVAASTPVNNEPPEKASQKEAVKPALTATAPDSVAKAQEAVTNSLSPVDSVQQAASEPVKPEEPKKQRTKGAWMASVYGGPNFGFNKNETGAPVSVKELTSFLLSAEIQRSVAAGFNLSTGLSYSKRTDRFSVTSSHTTVTTSMDSVPIYVYDSIIGGDTLIGYNVFPVTDSSSVQVTEERLERVSTIGFPLYASREFLFGPRWGLLVHTGVVFAFHTISYKSTGLTPLNSTYTSFALNGILRLHATYKWQSLKFSAGVTGGYDFKPAVTYSGVDRKRYYFAPQVGIHYTF